MKKLLSFLILSSGFGLYGMLRNPVPTPALIPASYVPAPGSLELSDTINPQTRTLARGVIMHALMNNKNLQTELQAIVHFDGRGQNLRTYQQIMDNLKNTTSTQDALAALQAFERVIMHLYDYRAYAIGSYKPGTSIFATGIKWSWINPISYINPKNYISDNNPELHQLINELQNIAKITQRHDNIIASRMMLTVNSYRHWRRNLAIACTLYLGANLCARGWENSSIKDLKDGGLSNSFKVVKKSFVDAFDTSIAISKGSAYIGKTGFIYIMKPCLNIMFNGYTTKQETPISNKPITSNIILQPIKQAPKSAPTDTTSTEPVEIEKFHTINTPKSIDTFIATQLAEALTKEHPATKKQNDRLNAWNAETTRLEMEHQMLVQECENENIIGGSATDFNSEKINTSFQALKNRRWDEDGAIKGSLYSLKKLTGLASKDTERSEHHTN